MFQQAHQEVLFKVFIVIDTTNTLIDYEVNPTTKHRIKFSGVTTEKFVLADQ